MPEEEKKQQEVVDLNQGEKIGFNSPAPVDDNQPDTPAYKKKIKFSNQRKTKLQKATFGFFIPSTILSIIAVNFFFMPFLSALAGVVAFFIIGIIIVAPVVFTLFLILMSEEYRQFAGKAWSIVEWFFDASNHIAEFAPYFPVVAFPALAFEIVEIILAITTLAKGQKGVVTYLIITSIFFTVLVVILIFYYAGGMNIAH